MAHRGGTVVRTYQFANACVSRSCRSSRGFSERNFLLQPTRMAEFTQIQSIQTLVSDCKEHAKACIKLRVAGAAETLSITCSSLDQAESLADLIDGYCRLVTDSNTSLWNRKGKEKSCLLPKESRSFALYKDTICRAKGVSLIHSLLPFG